MAKLPGAVQGARIVGERYVRAQRRQNPEGRMPLFDHLQPHSVNTAPGQMAMRPAA